jgi:hypothetical protein
MNPYFIAGSVIAVVLAFGVGYWKGDEAGQATVQQQWDKEKADAYAKYAEEVEKAREKEQNWQRAADNIRQEKDREIKNLNARATALSNSLRERQTRPAEGSAVSSVASVGQSGCTGKNLFREDGEFLVRIAREADELRAALKQCYTQYEAVR